MEIVIIIVLFIIAFIVYDTSNFTSLKQRNKRNKHILLKELNSVSNPFKHFIYAYRNDIGAIGIDKNEKKVVLINNKTDFQPAIYNFKDIIGINTRIDGQTTSSSSVGDTIGRSLIGGIIAGGAGAVVGGLSGSKVNEQEIKKLELDVLINNIDSSSLLIPFFSSDVPVSAKFSDELKSAKKLILEWENLFKVIIYQNSIDNKKITK